MHERTDIRLSAADRCELAAVVANRNSPQKHVWRAKIVLLTADGRGTAEIMASPQQLLSGSLYADFGAQGFWGMSLMAVAALPAIWRLDRIRRSAIHRPITTQIG
jgi:hypothetical protein